MKLSKPVYNPDGTAKLDPLTVSKYMTRLKCQITIITKCLLNRRMTTLKRYVHKKLHNKDMVNGFANTMAGIAGMPLELTSGLFRFL